MNPFERINQYSTPTPDGGVTFDAEAMIVDLITVFKASGLPRKALDAAVDEIWPKVKVEVKVPDSAKN